MDTKNLDLMNSMRNACKKIAPVWSLENSVAVNPYMGLIDQTFSQAAQVLSEIAGVKMTLPINFYMHKIEAGEIVPEDLEEVLQKFDKDTSAANFLASIPSNIKEEENTLAVFVDVCTTTTGKDWTRFMISRVSAWSASYFDNGQAMWVAANKSKSIYAAWKEEAEIDRSPEVMGLKAFRKFVQALPDEFNEAAQYAINILDVSKEALPTYLHSLLLRVGGWAAYAARLDWESELHGGKDGQLMEFLTVLLAWEACVLQSIQEDSMKKNWRDAKRKMEAFDASKNPNAQLINHLILQEAFDLSAQRKLISTFENSPSVITENKRQPKAQAIFCIDVRSEVFRRNLELVDAEIETVGFAGFFGFPINFVPIGHESGAAQCPALLPAGPTIVEGVGEQLASEKAFRNRTINQQVSKVWKSFKSGAVSNFSFVSPIGLSYLPKLLTDTFKLTRPVPHPDTAGLSSTVNNAKRVNVTKAIHNGQEVGIPLQEQIQMAKNALTGMSIIDNLAKLVLIAGHGATSVNNPHATGLDCGACGGHSGEANAKVAAEVLNNPEVREGLKKEGVNVPENTIFLACLHDTTTDEVKIFNAYDVPENRAKELADIQKSLQAAGHTTRTERAIRMGVNPSSNTDLSVISRSKDWSQTRPEFGLAGCSAFVVAPRQRTKNVNLGGRSFLHSYEWKKDTNFSILELIMTAPMVVTSWISLQYFASTVDNKTFGSGNKTLHNVTAGLGVLEGSSGDLRVGLPWQSVHDGEKLQHEPLRLSVIIEAPIAAMNAIIEKNQMVKDLVDHGWLHLMAMDENGTVSHRYLGNLQWSAIKQAA